MCEPWFNETYPTYIDLVSQDRQNCVDTGGQRALERHRSYSVGTHTGQRVVPDRAGRREEGGQQSCNSGWGTYTRGWDVVSSYVYYYFFPAILQEAECDTEFNETSV